jgi:hypothetical protein
MSGSVVLAHYVEPIDVAKAVLCLTSVCTLRARVGTRCGGAFLAQSTSDSRRRAQAHLCGARLDPVDPILSSPEMITHCPTAVTLPVGGFCGRRSCRPKKLRADAFSPMALALLYRPSTAVNLLSTRAHSGAAPTQHTARLRAAGCHVAPMRRRADRPAGVVRTGRVLMR